MYTHTFISHVSEVVNQLVGQASKFMQIWEPEVLELLSEITESDPKQDRKLKVLRLPNRPT